MLPSITIITITLNSLGDLFIYPLRGKNLDPELQYFTVGIVGTLLLAKTLEGTGWGHPHELDVTQS